MTDLIIHEPIRCEWEKLKPSDGECANRARINLGLGEHILGKLCWEHADELMAFAGRLVPLKESRQGWAQWQRDSASFKFSMPDQVFEVAT